ncbi:MAG: Tn3 family transposase, partial [Actinobacteria bacterium]|nr:Tn3 family transposase [Actinomycetota bacterium]
MHQPVIDALGLIVRYAGHGGTYYPLGEHIVRAVNADWTELLTKIDSRGRTRVVRGVYEACVFQALRERLRCKEMKKAVRECWGQVPLIDMVTEAALRTGMLGELTAVGSREALQRSVLWERLLLVAYAYGTNTAISAVAAGNHGHTEADLRYT